VYIQNSEELTSHGHIVERKLIIDIIEHSLSAADPYTATKNLVCLDDEILTVGNLHFDLKNRGDIYLLGAGKATYRIAKALEEILGDRITDGVIIIKDGQDANLTRVRLRRASHPIPDKRGFYAAQEMEALAKKAKKGDIVFCAITGGSSALAPLPVPSVTFEEKRRIHKLVLSSGATIREINAVRKHLSQIKGGRLALSVFPAEIINLTVSDVTEDALDYITGPTVPDTSTFADAIQVLKHYNLFKKIPKSAQEYLASATPDMENPKDFTNMPIHTFVTVKSNVACEAALIRAKELGMNAIILTTTIEGESKEISHLFTSIAREVRAYGRPFQSPCMIIAGGETTVTVHGRHGKGGPNQEMALSIALQLKDKNGIVFSALDTDGTDGVTEFAGGIVDSSTISRAKERGLKLKEYLFNHDATTALSQLDDAIKIGHTGTNINDLYILLMK